MTPPECSCGCAPLDEDERAILHEAMERARQRALHTHDFRLSRDPLTGESFQPITKAAERVLERLGRGEGVC